MSTATVTRIDRHSRYVSHAGKSNMVKIVDLHGRPISRPSTEELACAHEAQASKNPITGMLLELGLLDRSDVNPSRLAEIDANYISGQI